ncbi:aminoacyl-tRNA hydrolase [Candidatus Liberibacter asiaticus]|uniref:Peptidyl-tRNA hydrolase n=2 Tax=Liberibacter asiaticus TaxID=34021 RepID=C6XHF5_LIBAP|nr:aminoacyl-tRNA hydrolase [Candidatus Liberibacter asiaticus]ACT56698.1 peptidyl-tRNA hydrolase [Candidatus Liberibacter asiaticus str. psy62]AGH16465.1 peptidyl-tRNA hydrolase [Candidatus Liberibacter asiaticus str. gxpsy]ALK06871.1 aminoacyl-tRNA hydrolase [Candidatus Liberibacter asiaticus]ASK52341.1 aminoacyl-tRNA hydrolase [Candidatus Liberibacter asiaticus]AWL13664.1 aminoacyl-tRNA hydrolase [Candidatus Liberibacter asiaticus]
MFIVAGLGNPGHEYCENRHNIGFMCIDRIHSFHFFPAWKKKFHAEISEGQLDGLRTILIKPQTFMNLSGQSLLEVMNFYKLPNLENYLVIHDDLDLDFGTLRLKTGGGDAGHNGLKSISEKCGKNYKRLRIGIGRPPDTAHIIRHVLGNFSSPERYFLLPIIDNIARSLPLLAKREDVSFLNHIVSVRK